MKKPLSRRELALIAHAKKRAIARHEKFNRVLIFWNGKGPVVDMSLADIRRMNIQNGRHSCLDIFLSFPAPY